VRPHTIKESAENHLGNWHEQSGRLPDGAELELRFVVHFDHSPTHVVATFGADYVRWYGDAALWAEGRLLRLDSMVAATFARSRIGVFSLWNCHRSNYLYNI